ncbi:MAG: HAMP domain-containing sensor histidine kinase [Acidimicrobiia bacterium]
MEHLRVLVVDEGHSTPEELVAALSARVAGVEVTRVDSTAGAETAVGTVDVVVVAADHIDTAWVAARQVCGSVVVATARAATADAAPAGVHAVLVLDDTADVVAAQAAMIWRQLRAGQGRVLRLADETAARRENFLGHVSHELRTPLTAVYGTLEILTEQLYDGLAPPLKECLEIALRNCAQLRRMVDDLLDAASAERGHTRVDPERLSVAALLHDPGADSAARAAERGSSVVVDIADDLPDVLADPARARKIVDHLVDNAVKFSPEDSTIRVSATADAAAATVEFSVHDEGPGIDPAIAAALFDPLRQSVDELRSSRRGLGLGLYLCKRLVEAHGGRIWAQPGQARGTTFSFTLPGYTLEHMISALSEPGAGKPPAVSCVAIAVPVEGTGASNVERFDDAVRLVRSAIRDRDLVVTGFPEMAAPGHVGVLAACDEVGAAAIEARLRVRLASDQWRSLRAAQDPSILRVTVATRSGTHELPETEVARKIANHLESLHARSSIPAYMGASTSAPADRAHTAIQIDPVPST